MINGRVRRPPNGSNKYIYFYIFTAIEAESEGWIPVKIAYTHTYTRAPEQFITDRSEAVLSLWYFLLNVM